MEKSYAPVKIPTLCRYEHFKRCVESLSRCTGADQTELYIGLDYPANKSHVEGWKKISEYVDTITGFKEIHVFRRTCNWGAVKNMSDLTLHIQEKFNRMIYTEDDNEFAPNFLEYMNEGLEKYKDNNDVLRICGCVIPWGADFEGCMESYPYNAFPAHDFVSWGVGCWLNKNIDYFTKMDLLNSYKLSFKAIRMGYCLAVDRCLTNLNKPTTNPDICLRLYCAFNDKYCIFPSKSLVRNWGFDGSGLNSNNTPEMGLVSIDTSRTFSFDDFEIKDYPQVKMFVKQMYGAPVEHPKIKWGVLKKYLYYRILGKLPQDIPQDKNRYLLFILYFLKSIIGLSRVKK